MLEDRPDDRDVFAGVLPSGSPNGWPCHPSTTAGPDTPSPSWNLPPAQCVERHRRHGLSRSASCLSSVPSRVPTCIRCVRARDPRPRSSPHRRPTTPTSRPSRSRAAPLRAPGRFRLYLPHPERPLIQRQLHRRQIFSVSFIPSVHPRGTHALSCSIRSGCHHEKTADSAGCPRPILATAIAKKNCLARRGGRRGARAHRDAQAAGTCSVTLDDYCARQAAKTVAAGPPPRGAKQRLAPPRCRSR